MKKIYTKKQLEEAIDFWKKRLAETDRAEVIDINAITDDAGFRRTVDSLFDGDAYGRLVPDEEFEFEYSRSNDPDSGDVYKKSVRQAVDEGTFFTELGNRLEYEVGGSMPAGELKTVIERLAKEIVEEVLDDCSPGEGDRPIRRSR